MADAEKMLLKLLDDVAKEQGYTDYKVDFKPASSGGANITTALYSAVITGPPKEDLQLFAKIAILNEAMRKDMPMDLYEIENFAYNELVNIYNDMEDKYNIPKKDRLVFAKYYGGNSEINHETIVLENLVAKGFECHDRMKAFDWPYASKAVEKLAQFHAMSMAFGEENPEKFNSILNKYKFNFDSNEHNQGYLKKVTEQALSVLDKKKRGKMEQFLKQMTAAKLVEMNTPIRRPVLVHGDFRPSNLMHRANKDGSMEVIPVDLQTLRAGCGVYDIMYFIFAGSDKEFRKKYYTKLLDHYYDCLCARLKAAGLDPRKLYPRKDFDYEVKQLQPAGIMLAVFALPLITVETSDIPNKADDGADTVSAFAVNRTSSLFAERINEVVDDGLRWGIIDKTTECSFM